MWTQCQRQAHRSLIGAVVVEIVDDLESATATADFPVVTCSGASTRWGDYISIRGDGALFYGAGLLSS